MVASILFYCAVVTSLASLVARQPTIAVAALVVAVAALSSPAPTRHATLGRLLLDDVLSVFEFHERHSIRIHASVGDILEATRTVSADDVRLLRTLMWLRSLGRSRLLGSHGQPVLEAMQRSGFLRLAEDDHELVFGAVGRFWSGGIMTVATPAAFAGFDDPAFAKAATNFVVSPESDGCCRLTTETRIHGTDATSRRRFGAYWRVIYPGSALIRRMWLRAIAQRARVHASGRP